MNCTQNIRYAYGRFRKSERQVADYVLENVEEVAELTIRQLEEKCGVSQPSIMRFAKAAGYESYQAFKNHLWMELGENKNKLDGEVTAIQKVKLENIPELVSRNIVDSLAAFLQQLDYKKYIQAIHWINKSRTIDVYGAENSSGVASNLAGKLLHLGLCCRCNTDAFYQQIGAEHLTRKDLAIGISWSGRTKLTVDALQIAKRSGAKCIAITGVEGSPITEYADIVFVIASKPLMTSGEWLTSRAVQVAFCDMLYEGIARSIPGKYRQNVSRSEAMMTEDILYTKNSSV